MMSISIDYINDATLTGLLCRSVVNGQHDCHLYVQVCPSSTY